MKLPSLPATIRISDRLGAVMFSTIFCLLTISCAVPDQEPTNASSAAGTRVSQNRFNSDGDSIGETASILANGPPALLQSASNASPLLAAATSSLAADTNSQAEVRVAVDQIPSKASADLPIVSVDRPIVSVDLPIAIAAVTPPPIYPITKSPDITNFITLTEPLGIDRKDYPLQIGRSFAQGLFLSSIQLRVAGIAVPTQVDVKNRWPDGSIKFAILSVVLPSVASTSRLKIEFESVAKSLETQGPSLAAMLADNPKVDASMQVSFDGVTTSVNLRQMLRTVAPVFWTSGPISSTIVIADHSANRSFDFGGTRMKSVRPIFHLTIWHGLNIAKVRFIAEASNTQAFEDSKYDLKLKTGPQTDETMIYQQDAVAQHAGSRWTKTFWIGAKVQPVSLAANVAYLAKTRVIPNFDPNLPVPEGQIATLYAKWNASQQGLYGTGLWNKYMPAPGGRDEIAIFPNWAIDALISGDYRLNEISERNAELAAAWPMHFREGATGKYFDSAKTEPAIGSPITLNGRPSLNISIGNAFFRGTYIKPEDQLNFGLSATDNGWVPDGSHQPAPYILPYLQTGDYFYLEQMQLWASWGAYLASVALTDGIYGRGPYLTSGQLSGDIRSQAWTLRNRAAAAYFSPDSTKEKAYFSALVVDAIAIAEGIRGITGSKWESGESWKWGATVGRSGFYGSFGVHPLKMWESGSTGFAIPYHTIDPKVVQRGFAPFQMAYMLVALDHVRDLGFPSEKLVSWAAQFITEATKKPENANLLGVFAIPSVAAAPNGNFATWSSITATYSDPNYAKTFADSWLNSVDGMPLIMTAGAATIVGEPGGQASWDWIKKNWVDRRTAAVPARWAILPR